MNAAIVLFVQLNWAPCNVALNDITASEALEVLRVATSAIQSFDVVFETQLDHFFDSERNPNWTPESKQARVTLVRLPDGKFHRWVKRYRQVHQGLDSRYETLDAVGRSKETIVLSKGVRRSLDHERALGSISPDDLPNVFDQGSDYRVAYETVLGNNKLYNILAMRKKLVVERTHSASNSRIKFIAPPEAGTDLGRYGFRVSLDAAHQYLPYSVEWFLLIDGTEYTKWRQTVASYAKVDNGQWVPTKVLGEEYYPESKDPNFILRKYQLTVDMTRSSWNKKLPHSVFELAFPNGTAVNDGFQKNKPPYIVGQKDAEGHLKSIAKHAKADLSEATAPMADSDANSISLRGIAAVAIALCALITGGFTVRNWRKAPS